MEAIIDRTVVREECVSFDALTGSDDGAHTQCPVANPILHSHAPVVQVAVCI